MDLIIANQGFADVINGIIATIVGGLLTAFLLFVINEYLLPKANLTGVWKVRSITNQSSYNPYVGLELNYILHLLLKGNDLEGSWEKTTEKRTDGTEYKYEHDKRVHARISGHYERNYLSPSVIRLKVIEDGRQRESRAIIQLKIKGRNILQGSFFSTAGDSVGVITLTRDDKSPK